VLAVVSRIFEKKIAPPQRPLPRGRGTAKI